jgi:DNA polymerase III subunit epsilon
LYNRQLRRVRKMIAAMEVETEGYKTIQILEIPAIPLENIEKLIGVFRSYKQAKDFVRKLGKENGLCDKYLGLEKTKGACFAYQLSTCKGACTGEENALKYNMRFIQAISKHKVKSWPFSGPVVIKEQGENGEEGYIVDKWCLLGMVNGHIPTIEELNYAFDYDTYRILRRFLLPKSGKVQATVSNFYASSVY